MKIIPALCLLVFSFSTLAFEIKVSKMTPDREMERAFVLKTSLPEKVTLDCHSFLQGLRIGEYDSPDFYMLEAYECEELHFRIKDSLKRRQKHCIDVEEDIRADYSC